MVERCKACGVRTTDAKLVNYRGTHEVVSHGRTCEPLLLCNDCMMALESSIMKRREVLNPLIFPNKYVGFSKQSVKIIKIENRITGYEEDLMIGDGDYYGAIASIYDSQQRMTPYKLDRISEQVVHFTTIDGGSEGSVWSAELLPEEKERYLEDHPHFPENCPVQDCGFLKCNPSFKEWCDHSSLLCLSLRFARESLECH